MDFEVRNNKNLTLMILWTYADTNTILGKVTNQINQEEDLLLKTLYHAHK